MEEIAAAYGVVHALQDPLLVNRTSLEAYQNNLYFVSSTAGSTGALKQGKSSIGDRDDDLDDDLDDEFDDEIDDDNDLRLDRDLLNTPSALLLDDPLGNNDSANTGGLDPSFRNLNDLIIGNGIKNNGGFPLYQLNKHPSYNSTFKHHILDDVSLRGDESIQTLPNGPSNQFINSLLIRLPLSNDQSGNSPLNGLPIYHLPKLKNNLSSLGAESCDKIELYHANVITNKFINNKRRIRDYQWKKYFKNKSSSIGNLLTNAKRVSKDANYLSTFNKKMTLKREKIVENNKAKANLSNTIKTLKHELNEKISNELKFSGANVNSFEFANTVNTKFKFEKEEILNIEANLKSLNVLDFDKFTITDDDNKIPQLEDILSNRFNEGELSNDLQIIIEREFKIDDQNLHKYQIQLLGQQKASQFQQSLKNSYGTINSNIVRFKWCPNPNSIGFTNISNKKPAFLSS